MPVAVFDIDGTLTDTMDVDMECYVRAVTEELGVIVPEGWEELPEITDAAILGAAFERVGRTAPAPEDLGRVAERVGDMLAEILAEAPHRFRPLAGARRVFDVVRSAGWDVAMATGAWRPSAEVKLRGGGIPWDGVPLVTSSEAHARHEIIRQAVREARGDDAGRADEPVVYFGDGVWDGRAACRLGCAFVGVGTGRPEALREAGALEVLDDFADAAAVRRLLERVRTDG